jgi:hypothetical protein
MSALRGNCSPYGNIKTTSCLFLWHLNTFRLPPNFYQIFLRTWITETWNSTIKTPHYPQGQTVNQQYKTCFNHSRKMRKGKQWKIAGLNKSLFINTFSLLLGTPSYILGSEIAQWYSAGLWAGWLGGSSPGRG